MGEADMLKFGAELDLNQAPIIFDHEVKTPIAGGFRMCQVVVLANNPNRTISASTASQQAA